MLEDKIEWYEDLMFAKIVIQIIRELIRQINLIMQTSITFIQIKIILITNIIKIIYKQENIIQIL